MLAFLGEGGRCFLSFSWETLTVFFQLVSPVLGKKKRKYLDNLKKFNASYLPMTNEKFEDPSRENDI